MLQLQYNSCFNLNNTNKSEVSDTHLCILKMIPPPGGGRKSGEGEEGNNGNNAATRKTYSDKLKTNVKYNQTGDTVR